MRIDRAALARLVFRDGLIPVVAQDERTGEVLMVAWSDREALERSLASGLLHFWSRRRRALWLKGAGSGNVLRLSSLHADCDLDTVLALVRPVGPACHRGTRSCFAGAGALPTALADLIAARSDAAPEGSYTARLLADANLAGKKLGEEAVELAVACAQGDATRVREEAADLLFHLLVAAYAAGVPLSSILEALAMRRIAGE